MAQVLPFNGFYTGSDLKNSRRECVNFIPVKHDDGALSQYTLESTQGIGPDLYSDTDPLSGDREFKVVGKTFKAKISGDDYAITPGLLNNDSYAPALFYITFDGDEYLRWGVGGDITAAPDDDKRFVSTTGGQLTVGVGYWGGDQYITSHNHNFSDLGSVESPFFGVFGGEIVDIAYLGGRFIYLGAGRTTSLQRAYYSEILDPLNIDPLGYFGDVAKNATNVGMHALNERLFLFSTDGYTVWVNTPDVNLPFSMQTGSSGSIGLLSQDAKTEINGTLYFIGSSNGRNSLYATTGSTPTYIGNEYLDDKLSGVESANLFSFVDNNRIYLCISGDEAFCYDVESGEIHKRETITAIFGDVTYTEKWRVVGSEVLTGGNVMIGAKPDDDNPDTVFPRMMFGVADADCGTEFGGWVNRKLVTSPFNSDGVANNVRELAFQTSIKYSGAIYSPPIDYLNLSVSKDFGETYGDARQLRISNSGMLRFLNIGVFKESFIIKLETEGDEVYKILKMLVRLEKGFRQL